MTDGDQLDDEPEDAEPDDPRVDPDLPSEKQTAAEGGKVLTPEELEITDSEYVEELDESGRYVVSPGGGPSDVARSASESASESTSTGSDRRERPQEEATAAAGSDTRSDVAGSPEEARRLLADELARTNARYGIDIVARFDGQSVRHRTVSNDVVGTFENLIQWYASHVTDDTPVDEVVEILLNESSFGGGSEPTLAELLDAHDLDETDSVADLVEAIRVESGRDR